MDLSTHTYYTFQWEEGVLSFLWQPATEQMTGEDFKSALTAFAEQAEAHPGAGLLVDVSEFRHQPGEEVGPWRDREITPRYNGAGVRRFAYVLGEGKPLPPTGSDGQPAAPGEQFVTRYFPSRKAARAWLAGE